MNQTQRSSVPSGQSSSAVKAEGSGKVITEGAIKLVSKVASEQKLTDRMQILDAVCETLETRWTPGAMDSRLAQMGLQTTDRILYVIDMYLVGKNHSFF